MNNNFLLAIFLAVVFISCDNSNLFNPNHQIEEALEREVVSEPKQEILELLKIKSFDCKVIALHICVSESGDIVFGELLDEQTSLYIPDDKTKNVLRIILRQLKFNKGTKEEECGNFLVVG